MTSSPRLTFLTLCAAVASFTMLQSLVTPVLPSIQHDLHVSSGAVTWVLTAWLLAASIATPIGGRLGDAIGKDRTLTWSLAAIAAGCGISAIAPNLAVLILGRIVQGVGAGVMALSFGILRDEFPPQKLAGAVGTLSGVIAAGGGVGIILAGPLNDVFGWRGLFWIPMIVVAAIAVLAHRSVPASPVRTPGRIDWAAATLLSGWLVALLIAVSEGPSWGWTSGRVVGLIVAAAVLVAAWVRVELRSDSPLIDMRMMRLPAVWTTNTVALLFGASMFPVYAFLPQFMQLKDGFGTSVTGAGLLMAPMLILMALSGSYSSRLPIGPKAQLVYGSMVSVVAGLGFAAFHHSEALVSLSAAVFGFGLGIVYASMMTLIVRGVPAHQTGAASGMSANIRVIGGALGTAIVSAIITGGHGGEPTADAFVTGFLVTAGIAAVAAAAALLVPAADERPLLGRGAWRQRFAAARATH